MAGRHRFYRNGLLQYSIVSLPAILLITLAYATFTAAGTLLAALHPSMSPMDVPPASVSFAVSGLQYLWNHPHWLLALFLTTYLTYVASGRDSWNGEYANHDTPRWKLMAAATAVGGVGLAVLMGFENLAREAYVSYIPFSHLSYLPYVSGILLAAYYSRHTLLDDVANHGVELRRPYVWDYATGSSSVIGVYSAVVDFPTGGIYTRIAGAGLPLLVSTAYLLYRHQHIPREKERSRGDTRTAETSDQEAEASSTDELSIEQIDRLLASDNSSHRRHAVKELLRISSRHPEEASELVPRLLGVLENDFNSTRADAAHVMQRVAKHNPESVEPAIPLLDDLLEVNYPPAQKHALGCFAELADDYPGQVAELQPSIMKFKDTSHRDIRENAFRVVHKLEISQRSNEIEGNENGRQRMTRDSRDNEQPPPASRYFEPPPSLSFNDVGGMKDLKTELEKHVIKPLRTPNVYREHGADAVNGVLLHGPPGTGKTYIAKALAGELGFNFIEVHSSDVLSKYIGESANMVEELFDVAVQNQPCVVLMDELDAIAGKRDTGNQATSQRQMVSELLRQLTRIQDQEVVVIGATNIPEQIDNAVKRRKRFDKVFRVPLPDGDARRAIIKIHLKDSPVDLDGLNWDALIEETQGYAAGDLETIVDTAALMAAEEAQQTTSKRVVPITQGHLMNAIQEIEPSTKDISGAANYLREPPELSFSDVGGMEEVKEELRNMVIEPLREPEVHQEYGIDVVNAVLAHGPPGTGKTYVSKALAGEMEYNYIEVLPDDILSKWAGEAPNRLSEIFDVAIQNQPCVVLIDEIDAIATKRDSGTTKTQTDRQTVNQLLTELERIDGEEVVVMATTNMYDELDAAVVRSGRIDEKIEFPPPDPQARAEIMKIHLRKPPVDSDSIDWEKVRELTEGYVSSDLKRIVETAAHNALDEAKESDEMVPIQQRHIEDAIKSTESSLHKWR